MIENNSSYKDIEINNTTYVCKLKLLGIHNDNRYVFQMIPSNKVVCIFTDQTLMVREYMACPEGMFLVRFFHNTNKKYCYKSLRSTAITVASIKLIADFPTPITDVRSFTEELRTRLADSYEVILNNRDISIERVNR